MWASTGKEELLFLVGKWAPGNALHMKFLSQALTHTLLPSFFPNN